MSHRREKLSKEQIEREVAEHKRLPGTKHLVACRCVQCRTEKLELAAMWQQRVNRELDSRLRALEEWRKNADPAKENTHELQAGHDPVPVQGDMSPVQQDVRAEAPKPVGDAQ